MPEEIHETWNRIVLHADMDAFYAAVEQLDDPALRGRPILIGPDSDRGVVLTASYEARPSGAGSAMPMAQARRLCPEALIVPPRFERYREISARVMAVFRDFSAQIEPISLDEAFIDMTGSEHFFGNPRQMGKKLKEAIKETTGGLSASVGVSVNKFVAKVASNHQKPDGLTVVPEDRVRSWLAPQSIAVLWGAGRKTQSKLNALGYRTVADIAHAEPRVLRDQLGKMGQRFFELSNGRDNRPVNSSGLAKSLSCERTLSGDISDLESVKRHLRRAAETVAQRMRKSELRAQGVRVKLKTSDFRLLSRQRRLIRPSANSNELFQAALPLANDLLTHAPFRLVGLSAFGLTRFESNDQLALSGFDEDRTGKLDKLLDAASQRFGPGALKRARQLDKETLSDESGDLDFLDF